ncbi:MAG: VWA domain-containing protein [bacterium]
MPLLFSAGEATFRFPLVVAQRYIPGSPRDGASVGSGTSPDTSSVPDASRITPPVLLPGFKSPVRLNIEVSLDRGTLVDPSSLASSLHAVTAVSNESKTLVRVQPGEKVNRDFILRFAVARENIRSSFTVIPDAKGDGATYLLSMVPPMKAADARRPRDIVFVLDRSGSMEGWKMVAARRAVGRMIDTLNADDTFQVLAFDDAIETPKDLGKKRIEANNRNRYRAIEWLATCNARGGTEMAQPLFDALELLDGRDSGRDRYVVLVTDGQVGNEDQIVKGVRARMKSSHVFTVGIDRAVNAGFLNRLADISGGRCELVESEDRLDDVMSKLHQMIDTPVLNEVTLRIEGAMLVPTTAVPERPTTLFAAAPLTMAGRLTGKGPIAARVRGVTPGQVLFEEVVEAEISNEPGLAAVWARQKLRALEDQYASDYSKRHSIEKQLVETSLRFNVLCRFTSFVAIDEESRVEGDLVQVTQPVEAASGWGHQGSPPPAQRAMSMPMSPMAAMPLGGAPMSKMSAPRRAEASVKKEMMAPFADYDDADDFASYAVDAEEAAAPADYADLIAAPEKPSPKGSLGRAKTRSGVVRTVAQSPEQARGLHLAPQHDVFVLGLMWARLLLGRDLVPAKSADVALAAWDPATLPAELSPYLSVLSKALAADPRDRFADASAFLEAVVDLAASLGIKPTKLATGPIDAANDAFGPYTLVGLLADTGSYAVWMARRGGESRVLRILSEAHSEDEDAVDRFFEEVRVDVPHVLPMAEFGVEQGQAYIAYRGEAAGPLPKKLAEAQAFAAIVDAAKGLVSLHAAHVAHEELDLADLIVDREGHAAWVGLGRHASAVNSSPSFSQKIVNWVKPLAASFWK